MTLYIFRGLPGSGKSTKAREMQKRLGGRVVERDDIRYMLFGRYTDVDELLVTEVQNTLIDQGLRMGENVFVSDMNLRNQYVKRLFEKAWAFNANVEVVDMTNVDYNECILRNRARLLLGERSVPEELILDLYNRFVKGKGYPLPVTFTGAKMKGSHREREVYTPDVTKQKAIICDIDGTLARMTNRGPFDEHLVKNDELIEPVAHMVEQAALSGLAIVFMSGRTDGCREDTWDWLVEKMPWLTDFDVWSELHMRRSVEDRGRPDDDVKYDMFYREVAHRFNVMYVIDDRDKVVKMWRAIGLTCAQVAYGDF